MVDKDATETLLADAAGIARAAKVLREGGLVAVPTETVYGLAARADSEEAVARIYDAKGRPSFNPLIVHVRDAEQAGEFGRFSRAAEVLARSEWPGPLTLVVPKRPGTMLASSITAGLATVALRCPAHPVMQALLQRVDFPLAAPSANPSGFVTSTTAQHVAQTLDGRIDLILDEGQPTPGGLESTIIAVRDDGSLEELRPGPVDLATWSKVRLEPRKSASIEAPGQLSSHYAPGKPMRLNAVEVAPDDFVIGFGKIDGDCTLSDAADLREAAANLYACLHLAARSDKPCIAVAPIPDRGIGKAINDRLRRAATPA